MAKEDLHVIVAGAGLGGLTAALALAQQGIKVPQALRPEEI